MTHNKSSQITFVKFASILIFTLIEVNSSYAVQMGELASQEQARGIVGISNEASFSTCIGVVLEPTKVLTTVTCTGNFNGSFAAEFYRVHPLNGLEIGGGFTLVLDESVEPFVGVNQIISHPQNNFRLGSFNLAILDLAEPLTISSATIYGGDESVVGLRANSFGWRRFERTEFLTRRFFEANVLALPPIVPASDDFEILDSGGCFDSDVSENTIYCAGFRNDSMFMEFDDQGGPLYFDSSQGPLVIGLLQQASGGFENNGEFRLEEYANVSVMRQFIEDNAPNTQFVNSLDEGDGADPNLDPQPIVVPPIIELILSADL